MFEYTSMKQRNYMNFIAAHFKPRYLERVYMFLLLIEIMYLFNLIYRNSFIVCKNQPCNKTGCALEPLFSRQVTLLSLILKAVTLLRR